MFNVFSSKLMFLTRDEVNKTNHNPPHGRGIEKLRGTKPKNKAIPIGPLILPVFLSKIISKIPRLKVSS